MPSPLPSDEVLPAPTLSSRLCNLSSRRRSLGRTSFKPSNRNDDANRCSRRHQGFDPAPTPSSHNHHHSTNPSNARKQNYSIEVKLSASSALYRTWPQAVVRRDGSGLLRSSRAAMHVSAVTGEPILCNDILDGALCEDIMQDGLGWPAARVLL